MKAKTPPNPERAFGLSVGTVLILIAAFAAWRERYLVAEILGGLGAVLLVLGYLKPLWLYWPSKAWWRMAMALGHINARVILTVAFTLVFVPLSLTWRLIGRDPLGRRRSSWQGWQAYPPRYRDRNHYLRMY
ncbi:MAG: SxtJ family membrane protein [Acidobacteriota bacterium]|nr:SxtJ family membrane protein [Acidobacteriota bacterium]